MADSGAAGAASRALYSFAAQLLSFLLVFLDRFVLIGILLGAWGIAVYSDWVIAASTAGLFSIAEGGLNVVYGNKMRRARLAGDDAELGRAMAIAIGVSLGLALACAVILLLGLALLDLRFWLGTRALDPRELALVVGCLGLVTISLAARGAVSQRYRAEGEFTRSILMGMLPQGVAVMSVCALAWLGWRPSAVAIAYVALDLVLGWGVMLADMRRRYSAFTLRPGWPTRAEIGAIVGEVRWLAAIRASIILVLHLPVLLLAWFSAASGAIVAFTLVRTLVSMGRQLGSMLSISIGVALADSILTLAPEERARQIHRATSVLTTMATCAGVAVLLFGQPVFSLWARDATLFDWRIALPLAIGCIASGAASTLSSVLMFSSLPRIEALISLGFIAVTLAGLVLLIPPYGTAGAAAAVALGEIVAFGVLLPVMGCRAIGISARQYLGVFLTAGLRALAIAGSVAMAVAWLTPPTTLAAFLAGGALWCVFGFLPAMLFALPEADRARLLRPLARLLGRAG